MDTFQIYSVSELTAGIKQTVGSRFRDILVQGEVSNAKLYPSGHFYFTLKDDYAMIRAVVFGYSKRYPAGVVKDGAAIVCGGRVDIYEKRGEYQLIVDMLEVKGVGLLQIKFQMLKEKLFKEGLFDAESKKPIPVLPRLVGIVTSPAGAAIRDMLKIIGNKFENMAVEIYPVKVQGEEAPREIIEGIQYFNEKNEADVIIVGRGGGSLEDLAPFNEETVARAIYASRIPVISAVGHEIDFTIADFVADVRAPTPTAAADMAVPDKDGLIAMLENMGVAIHRAITRKIDLSRRGLYEKTLELKEKKEIFTSHKIYLDDLTNNLTHAFHTFFSNNKNRLNTLAQRLADLNPDNTLRRGYSITMKPATGEVVTDAGQVGEGEDLAIRLFRGKLAVKTRGMPQA